MKMLRKKIRKKLKQESTTFLPRKKMNGLNFHKFYEKKLKKIDLLDVNQYFMEKNKVKKIIFTK